MPRAKEEGAGVWGRGGELGPRDEIGEERGISLAILSLGNENIS